MSEDTKIEKRSLKDHPTIRKVMDKIRITKVVATRSVKGRNGDHYVGFSAAWDSTQDDAGGAADLVSIQESSDTVQSQSGSGLSIREAKVAALILGMQADRAAHQNAWAGGSISKEHRADALKAINANYGKLLMDVLNDAEAGENAAPPPSEG